MLTPLKFAIRGERREKMSCMHPLSTQKHFILSGKESELWGGTLTSIFGNDPDRILLEIATIEPGIYEVGGFNFDHDMEGLTEWKARNYGFCWMDKKSGAFIDGFEYDYAKDPKKFGKYIRKVGTQYVSLYGVADNVEQIKKYFEPAIKSQYPFVISLTEINKKTQPASGGWRWHKWGDYIGTQKSEMEYIYDEPNIDKVFVFHGYYLEKQPIEPETN